MKKIDLANQRFGRLTVICESEQSTPGRIKWMCRCDCGNIAVVSSSNLTHNMKHTRIYSIWCDMKKRCYNVNNRSFINYGARGISVCNEWRHDFVTFYTWAMANGYNDSLFIDRIDTDGNYEPSNCRWATWAEQQRNKRNTIRVSYDGKMWSLHDLCEEFNFPQSIAAERYEKLKKNGKVPTFENLIAKPITKYNRKYVTQLSVNDEIVNVWDSIVMASNAVNRNHSAISMCIAGKTNLCAGYKWRYSTEEDLILIRGSASDP